MKRNVSTNPKFAPQMNIIIRKTTIDTFLNEYTGCSGKNVFFTIHYNPSLAYIAVRDLQSAQRNAGVQSLLLVGNFCTTNSS